VLKAGMNEYFTKYALKNTTLPDFLECLQKAANESGQSDADIQGWTDSWLTKAGVNEITADLQGIDENGNGSIIVSQSLPVHGDQVYHEQKMQMKLFNWTSSVNEGGVPLVHVQDLHLQAEE